MPIIPRLTTWRTAIRRGDSSGLAPPVRVTPLERYEIHSYEYGEGGDDLILLHGLSGSSRWWYRNIPDLARRHHVVVPDLIGFGRSRWRGQLPDIDTLAELLCRWISESGMERAHVVGHSMGGQIAIHLAAHHPEVVQRLVLVGSAGIPRPLSPGDIARFAKDIAPLWRWGDPTFLPTIFRDAWTAGPRTLLQAVGHILRDDVRDLLPEISVPTLIVWGERDHWVPVEHARQMRELIPDSQLVVFRNAAHNVMIDRPQDFDRVLLRFLEGAQVGH